MASTNKRARVARLEEAQNPAGKLHFIWLAPGEKPGPHHVAPQGTRACFVGWQKPSKPEVRPSMEAQE